MLIPPLAGLLLACTDPVPPGPDDGVTAEVSAHVSTVVTVRWTTDAPTTGTVSYGPAGEPPMTTPTTPEGTEHEAVLLGLWPDSTFELQVQASDGWTSDVHEVTTGALPSGIPRFSAEGAYGDLGGVTLIPTMGGTTGVYAVDRRGRVLWYHEPDPAYAVLRAHLSPDGDGVLMSLAAPHDGDLLDQTGVLHVSWDGAETELRSLPGLAHDLQLLPDGTLAGLCLAEDPDHTALGDRIVELAPDGTLTEVWNSWEAFDPAVHGTEYLDDENWTHANALGYDADDDAWLVSLRHFSSVVKVDRATGDTVWALGGELDQFTWLDGATPPIEQHEPVAVDGGLLLFDNGDADRDSSRVVEYALDTSAMTVRQTWEHHHDPDLFVYAKGGVDRLADGSTQVAWSTSGELEHIDPDGVSDWSLSAPLGTAVVFPTHVGSLYTD